MSDIFLSYANNDQSRLLRLVTALEAKGWVVFWDRAISTGKTWHDTLGNELDACACVVVVWSQHSVRSRWVYEEAEEGRKKGVLFPVILDQGVVPPVGFRALQTADLSQWQGEPGHPGFMQLTTEIAACFGGNKACHDPVIQTPNAPATLVRQLDPASASQPGLDEAALQQAKHHLAYHLGPIAGLLVRRAAPRAANLAQLVQLLAAELTDENQRTDFIRRMKS